MCAKDQELCLNKVCIVGAFRSAYLATSLGLNSLSPSLYGIDTRSVDIWQQPKPVLDLKRHSTSIYALARTRTNAAYVGQYMYRQAAWTSFVLVWVSLKQELWDLSPNALMPITS